LLFYHLLNEGQACFISRSENHSWFIASFISSLSSTNFELSAVFAKVAPDFRASSIGSKGVFVFQRGVVFVFAQTGVVGEACPVVRA
jgi:hypothetical protein